MNCWVTPSGVVITPPLVTAIDSNVADDTVNVVAGADIPLNTAPILVVPVATEVTNPLLPNALLMVAVDVVVELHVTKLVIFWVEPSL